MKVRIRVEHQTDEPESRYEWETDYEQVLQTEDIITNVVYPVVMAVNKFGGKEKPLCS